MTVSYVSLDESGSNFAIVVATSLLFGFTHGSSDAYFWQESVRNNSLPAHGLQSHGPSLPASDALDTECVQTLAKHYPANRANAFLDWFTYSDNTIDGQSK